MRILVINRSPRDLSFIIPSYCTDSRYDNSIIIPSYGVLDIAPYLRKGVDWKQMPSIVKYRDTLEVIECE
jgi:hypothetical protein